MNTEPKWETVDGKPFGDSYRLESAYGPYVRLGTWKNPDEHNGHWVYSIGDTRGFIPPCPLNDAKRIVILLVVRLLRETADRMADMDL
jgi:hypothetical protein